MIDEIITSIKQAEQKAEQIVAAAKQTAREKEENLSRSLSFEMQKQATDAKNEYKAALLAADKEIEESVLKKKEAALDAYSQTIKKAESNLAQAVDFLTEEFLSKYVRN